MEGSHLKIDSLITVVQMSDIRQHYLHAGLFNSIEAKNLHLKDHNSFKTVEPLIVKDRLAVLVL